MQGISYLLIASAANTICNHTENPLFSTNFVIYRFFAVFPNFILYIYIPYFYAHTYVLGILHTHKKTSTFLPVKRMYWFCSPYYDVIYLIWKNCRKAENRNMFPDKVLLSNYSATIHFQMAQIHGVSSGRTGADGFHILPLSRPYRYDGISHP